MRSSCPRRSGSRRSGLLAASTSTTAASRGRGARATIVAGDELCERAHVLVGRAAVERHEHVEALAARRLRERLETDERRAPRGRAARPGSSATTAPRASGRGRRARSPGGRAGRPANPRVHVDARHVRHPEQRQLVVHERERDLALRLLLLARSRRAHGTSGSSPACATARPSGRTPCRRCRRGSGAS